MWFLSLLYILPYWSFIHLKLSCTVFIYVDALLDLFRLFSLNIFEQTVQCPISVSNSLSGRPSSMSLSGIFGRCSTCIPTYVFHKHVCLMSIVSQKSIASYSIIIPLHLRKSFQTLEPGEAHMFLPHEDVWMLGPHLVSWLVQTWSLAETLKLQLLISVSDNMGLIWVDDMSTCQIQST